MDRINKAQRSANMKAIKSKDTSIELLLRKALWHKGVHYRKNFKVCDCKPDIVITKYKLAIFCDGDFWHGNDKYKVKTNTSFWEDKIKDNKDRDLNNTINLRDNGWIVLRFWGSQIKANLELCVNEIMIAIQKRQAR